MNIKEANEFTVDVTQGISGMTQLIKDQSQEIEYKEQIIEDLKDKAFEQERGINLLMQINSNLKYKIKLLEGGKSDTASATNQ